MKEEDHDIRVDASELRELVVAKLAAAGLIRSHAEQTADVLVSADVRGVYSHGLIRVEHYVKRLLAGSLNVDPHFSFRRLRSGSGLLDADSGMGHVAGIEAMDHAVEMAADNGIAMVGIKDSSHCGALSYFVARATEKKMIGIALIPGNKLVAPYAGCRPFFGTNPLAMGFPCKKNPAVIIDMATSYVAFGKILDAREKGVSIPADWGLDENGKPTTDPHQVRSLTPFGGYKGYALGMAIDVLAGVLIGASFGPHIKAMYADYETKRELSGLMIAIDPSTFIPADAFMAQMDAMLDQLHTEPPGPGFEKVLVPGDPEWEHQRVALKDGVPVVASIYDYLKS